MAANEKFPSHVQLRVESVAALLHPTSIAIVGASPRPGGWTRSISTNLQRFGFKGPIYGVNPITKSAWSWNAFRIAPRCRRRPINSSSSPRRNASFVADQHARRERHDRARVVAKTAPPDGTYLTMVTPSFPMEQTLGTNKNLNIDCNAMNWIGNLSYSNTFLLTSKNSPTKSLAIARTRTTLVSVPTQEDVTAYMTLRMNQILGTRFRLVADYTSGPEMNLAMRRGEIEAPGTTEPPSAGQSPLGPAFLPIASRLCAMPSTKR